MLIEVLECSPDGTQELVQREVADNWYDEPVPSAQARLDTLRAQLAETDYKIIKCSEYQMAGLELPYDLAVLHAERQTLRDEINALEEEMNGGEHT